MKAKLNKKKKLVIQEEVVDESDELEIKRITIMPNRSSIKIDFDNGYRYSGNFEEDSSLGKVLLSFINKVMNEK